MLWMLSCFLAIQISILGVVRCVEIRRLSVPRWVENGTRDSVVLDCEYVYNENDLRLVVKWFFKDNTEPIYQWIPEYNTKHTHGLFKERVDLNYSVNPVDAYSQFRALKIQPVSKELSGKYTCLVTSLAGQDSRSQDMTVFVSASNFEVRHKSTPGGGLVVECRAEGVFPEPTLALWAEPTLGPAHQVSGPPTWHAIATDTGLYTAVLRRHLAPADLSDVAVLKCVLEILDSQYRRVKSFVHLQGTAGLASDLTRGGVNAAPGVGTLFLNQFILVLVAYIAYHIS